MMKRITLKGLRISSQSKDKRFDSRDDSPRPQESQYEEPHSHKSDDYNGKDKSSIIEELGTPKRREKKGFFRTLKKKLTPKNQRKKDACTCTSNIEEDSSTTSSHGEKSPVPGAVQSNSLRGVPRRRDTPLRGACSEEALESSDGGGIEDLPRRQRRPELRRIPDPPPPDKSKEDSSTGKSEEDDGDKDGGLLPPDTEYGHATAPPIINICGSTEETVSPVAQALPAETCANVTETHSTPRTSTLSSNNRNLSENYETYDHAAGTLGALDAFVNELKETPRGWSLTRELFRLSKHGWYWGPITRVEAEDKLADQPDGAFLVRDSSDDRYLLSLSFRSYGRTLHTRIEHCNGVFSFYAQPESEGYTSIVDLIEHSMTDSQTGVFCYSRARTPGSPSFPVRLTRPVSRLTQVRSLQYLCRFIIRQYTRFDHIQSLPLPTRIKGWLEENQY